MQILVNLLVLVSILSINVNDLKKWEVFESREGNFAILAPGEFELKEKKIMTAIGEIECATFVYQSSDPKANNKLYTVSYCDYPEYTFPIDSLDLIEEFFQASIEQETENLKGELSYVNKSSISGFPGKLFRIAYNEGNALMKSKVFLVHDRFYSVQVFTTFDKSLNFDMDKYLNSFRLLID